MPTTPGKGDVGKWTRVKGPRVAATPPAATEMKAGGGLFRTGTAGVSYREVSERANPGRPGGAKPQISPVEMAGLPKRLRRSTTRNFSEVQ